MQCTSNIPLYTREQLNVGASGFSWRPYNVDSNYEEERGCNVYVPPCSMNQNFGYHKEVVKQTMQNHEAIFKYQVQELHRLYNRQKELVGEIRAREFIPHYQSKISEKSKYFPSRAQQEISQTKPRAPSWILGDCLDIQPSILTSERIQQPQSFIAKNFLEPGSLLRGNIYNEVEVLLSKSEQRILDLELPTDAYYDNQKTVQFEEMGSGKTEDLSDVNISSIQRNYFLDLNGPVQLEKVASISTDPFENCTNHMDIDLNSVPDSCLMEEIVIKKKLRINTFIDLNTSIFVDEPSPPLSSTNIGIESDVEGPVSSENKEGSPPRGNSEEIQLGPPIELDAIAAETLMKISCRIHEHFEASTEPFEKSFSNLCWFAEIVSSTGDDLAKELMNIQNDSSKNYKGRFKVSTKQFVLALASPCKDLHTIEEFHNAGLRKKAGRNSFVKRRKLLNFSLEDVVLQGWGKIKKRQGVVRRPASKFIVIIHPK